MSVKTDLREELVNEIDELGKVEFGSEKYKVGVSGVSQLADKLIELSRLDQEDKKLELEQEKLEVEYQKLEDERKDKKSKNRIGWAGVLVPASIAVIGGVAMFVYEERGSITSQMGRKLIDKYIFRVK